MTFNEVAFSIAGIYVGLVIGANLATYLISRRRAYSFRRDGEKFTVLRDK